MVHHFVQLRHLTSVLVQLLLRVRKRSNTVAGPVWVAQGFLQYFPSLRVYLLDPVSVLVLKKHAEDCVASVFHPSILHLLKHLVPWVPLSWDSIVLHRVHVHGEVLPRLLRLLELLLKLNQVLLLLDGGQLLKVPIIYAELLLPVGDDSLRRTGVPWEVEHEVLYHDRGGDIKLVTLAFITIRRVLLGLVLIEIALSVVALLHEGSLRVLSEEELGHVYLVLRRLHLGMHLRGRRSWDGGVLDLEARI